VKITWITRSFLDYRVPVYEELNRLVNGGLTLVYYGEVVPERVSQKVRHVLGEAAIALNGEWRFAGPKVVGGGFANEGIRIPYQRGLVSRALKSKPDVVISDGFFQWTYAALWLRATRGMPHVMCYERTAHTDRKAQWYRIVYRKTAMRWIDAMCCNGRLCGEYVQSLGFPADRITFGHMVADVEGMRHSVSSIPLEHVSHLAAELRLKGLVFLYVGQLIPRKGIHKLLEAWRMLFATVPPDAATLLLVGDGSQRPELEQYCAENCLTNVRLVGDVDYDELGPFYKSAHVFVIPTLEDNWSLVVPEAMACGLPVLCSKYNGCWPEYVTPANGWVFDPLDIDATVDCLGKCLSVRKKLSEMGNVSREIISRHTAKQAAEAILDACDIAMRHIRKA
jgi:glycosyltransferase involved in cell wall biosynthesis